MTGITLIITPDALIEQWSKEIRKHAGESLSVLRYDVSASFRSSNGEATR